MRVKYSVDMLRFRVKLENKNFAWLFEKLKFDPGCTHWVSTNYKQYHDNFKVDEVDSFGNTFSYWMGAGHNTEKPTDKKSLVIEYNPNKCRWNDPSVLLHKILRMYFSGRDVEVMSCDIACDFAVNILDLFFDKNRVYKHRKFDNGGDDVTHYFGAGDGQVKIYNKAREQGLDGVTLTRYEVSKKIRRSVRDVLADAFSIDCTLIDCYYSDQLSIVEDPIVAGLVFAVQQGFPLERLTRTYKKKVRQILECGDYSKKIPVDGSQLALALKEHISLYKNFIVAMC